MISVDKTIESTLTFLKVVRRESRELKLAPFVGMDSFERVMYSCMLGFTFLAFVCDLAPTLK